MIKTSSILLLFWLVCAAWPAGAQTYLGVLTAPANSGPGGSCCSSVATLDANNSAVPSDGSCVGCSVITQAQYKNYLMATAIPAKTKAATAAAVSSGITLTCSTTPSLSGTYSVDSTMMTELLTMKGLSNGNSFPADFTTVSVQDTSGGLHTFPSGKVFDAFYQIVAWYWVQLIDAKQRITAGQSVSFPVATSTAC